MKTITPDPAFAPMRYNTKGAAKEESEARRSDAACSDMWEYSKCRSSLRRNGAVFALMTSDGKASLNQEEQAILLAALNRPNAENCSAISDTDRIDWLQANQKTAWRVTHDEWEQTTETRTRHIRITVFDGWVVNEQDEPKKDIRAAIDSAIHSQNAKNAGDPPTSTSTEANQ